MKQITNLNFDGVKCDSKLKDYVAAFGKSSSGLRKMAAWNEAETMKYH